MIVCTSVGQHGSGIVSCGHWALVYNLFDRVRLYRSVSVMACTLCARCKSAMVALFHALDISLYSSCPLWIVGKFAVLGGPVEIWRHPNICS